MKFSAIRKAVRGDAHALSDEAFCARSDAALCSRRSWLFSEEVITDIAQRLELTPTRSEQCGQVITPC